MLHQLATCYESAMMHQTSNLVCFEPAMLHNTSFHLTQDQALCLSLRLLPLNHMQVAAVHAAAQGGMGESTDGEQAGSMGWAVPLLSAAAQAWMVATHAARLSLRAVLDSFRGS